MNASEIIDTVKAANKIEDIFPDINNYNTSYKKYVSIIHPDVCHLSGAGDALAKINQFVHELRKGGKVFYDESGSFTSNGYSILYKGEENNSILQWSIKNYKMMYKDAPDHLKNYIPISIDNGTSYNVKLKERSICISGLSLPQEHVNWILSRLLEFSTMIADGNLSHCGLCPESVFVVPETHGIVVTSFYHLTALGKKVGTINAAYKNWYPSDLFKDKIAIPYIDVELCKKIAIKLLGDSSGIGTRLKGTINDRFLNFIFKRHSTPLEAYQEYREMLSKTFEKKFHILNI